MSAGRHRAPEGEPSSFTTDALSIVRTHPPWDRPTCHRRYHGRRVARLLATLAAASVLYLTRKAWL